jgi:GNAT superfamily N-acetyltransferase
VCPLRPLRAGRARGQGARDQAVRVGVIPSRILSLRDCEHDPAVAELLALAQIHRAAADAATRGPHIAAEYADAADLHLYGYELNDRIIGVIGIQPQDGNSAIIRDLAVAPNARRLGIGRALIDHLRNELALDALEGDTLQPAVDFYRRCGFAVSANGTMSTGATRYRFVWQQDRTRM